jgi:hypothetical protein
MIRISLLLFCLSMSSNVFPQKIQKGPYTVRVLADGVDHLFGMATLTWNKEAAAKYAGSIRAESSRRQSGE